MSVALRVADVSLSRRTQEEFDYDLKRTLFRVLQARYRSPSKREVLSSVTIAIEAGEKVGIIGPNGSGKSTLLKVLSGILRPSSGVVTVDGLVSPLIELGVGFDPDLSLIDNIVYYGALLGHPEKLVRAHVDSILDFAELFPYRHEPTKTLSSGMAARLGFAIATEFRPDVLLLDEVLSVGDERFRRKCSARVERFWDAHSTILVVSHDLQFIEAQCDRVIWMEAGKVRFDGPSPEGVRRYFDTVPSEGVFRRGDELVALAQKHERGEIVVRGTSRSPQGEKVYLIREGRRHWVTTNEWYGRTGYRWEDIVHVDDAVILEVPEGERLV